MEDDERAMLENMIARGDASALTELVDHYIDYESPVDALPLVLKVLEASAKKKSPQAAFYLYHLYDQGDYYPLELIKPLVRPDRVLAEFWFDRALEYGHPEALLQFAMDAVKAARFSEAAKALTEIEQIEPPSIYGDSIEMLHEVKIEAARMKKDLEQSIEKHATKQELLANSESASAEALYNAAHEILNSDAGPEAVKEAIRYLELAAAKGLALARKRLAGVLPD